VSKGFLLKGSAFLLIFIIMISFNFFILSCRRPPCNTSAELHISTTEVDIGQGVDSLLICPGESVFLNWQTSGAALVSLSLDTDGDGNNNNQTFGELPPTDKDEFKPETDTNYKLIASVSAESTCSANDDVNAFIVPENDRTWRVSLTGNSDGSTFSGGVASSTASSNIVVISAQIISSAEQPCWSVTHTNQDVTSTTFNFANSSPVQTSEFPIIGSYDATPYTLANGTCDFTTPITIKDRVELDLIVMCKE